MTFELKIPYDTGLDLHPFIGALHAISASKGHITIKWTHINKIDLNIVNICDGMKLGSRL